MRYVCIHSHFYQPPRENPWLESIELQDSAYPYHDWNERIAAECYAPNGASRILDGDNRIVKIVNNYSLISFNFGPTLLSWAESKSPDTYAAILRADRESAERFSGHGSALAQAYNHMIMPLANRRDKYTQIYWGIADFQHRFGRFPEGMWLPETAVDLETLDLMAEQGIKFTILAPYQCRRVRKIGGRAWRDVTGGKIDPSMPYRIKLPSHRTIDLFFYDGPVSRAVAFERLLDNGERFAERLLGLSDPDRDGPELLHIATDGETYGHHHSYGEMALTYALHHIESNGLARITNYGEFLEQNPPTHEVEIYENTAWSCAHGVERWRSDCGCNSGGRQGWNQAWRTPLRQALDWLRDCMAARYEESAGRLLRDPWNARDEYVRVVLDRSPEVRARFLRQHVHHPLSDADQVVCWKLLELQRHAMLMYTSCGWFFDDLSGIETVQVIQYAGRVVQLAEELFGEPMEAAFIERLAKAKSNMPEHGDGASIYEKFVRPAMVDFRKVGAHYAISSLFEPEDELKRIYCYSSDREDYHAFESGNLHLALGRVRLTSEITQTAQTLTFGVLHFGDHNVSGGVREYLGPEPYSALLRDVSAAFGRADLPEVLRLLDRGFGKNIYSLKSLFRDEQRRIMRTILTSTLGELGAVYRQLYERYSPLMSFLADLDIPLPKVFHATAEYALNSYFRRIADSEELDFDRVRTLVAEAKLRKVELDSTTLEYSFRQRIEKAAEQVEADPTALPHVRTLSDLSELIRTLPFHVNLWGVQNRCYALLQNGYRLRKEAAESGDREAREWVALFEHVCENSGVCLP